uniref:Uncharacterized protein n=1 Tax=Parascaris equorum TaxID=6256 RepID=A0A914SBV4_PAREQ
MKILRERILFLIFSRVRLVQFCSSVVFSNVLLLKLSFLSQCTSQNERKMIGVRCCLGIGK